MSLSLFDIIGPIMLGPSSSHTAGATRIGFLAGLIAGSEPRQVTLNFHPVLMQTYAGHKTHAGLIGGLLGFREDDLRLKTALEIAAQKGVAYRVEQVESPDVHQNTMRLKITTKDGLTTVVNGISVGGGCIEITQIDGVAVKFDGNYPVLIVHAREAPGDQIRTLLSGNQIIAEYSGATGKDFLRCWVLQQAPSPSLLEKIDAAGGAKIRSIPPLSNLQQMDSVPAFSTFEEMVQFAGRSNLAWAAVEYERRRTGRTAAEIKALFRDILRIMRESIATGLETKLELIGGFCAGDDGAKMLAAYRGGKTISGGILALAIARALSVAEVSGAMGRVVAAPTAGSAGVLPGVLLSVAEELGKSDEEVRDALLVAAAVGVVIANKSSLSGAVGGCQGEIGVASAMTASAATFLGGGDAGQCVQAAALTLKNLLGLICDPAAGPVEVPCIKRNAIGVAAALMAADMALAGIRSYIPPDEVVDALTNVQKLLPQELKGSTIGGLGCTRTAHQMRTEWQQKLKQMA